MGSILSRSSVGRGSGGSGGGGNGGDDSDSGSGERAYRYPPKSGSHYFSNHFIMGEEKFESPQPESFLFGENTDLNFLSSKPLPFPYPPPQSSEPTKTLKSLVNIRRDSLRFVKIEDGKYGIEFLFDSDVKCSVTIYHFASEELPVATQGVSYSYRFKSETYHYKRGAAQRFSQPSYSFEPDNYTEEELTMVNPDFSINFDLLPIVIHCVSEEGEDPKQSHSTIGIVEKYSDGSYILKAVKQKIFVDGLSYLLQEIYGLENKTSSSADKSNSDEEADDCGSECVVCMCDLRDTIILPCRHLCLCNACADSLRYQANNCPICRAPFRALLQIRALHKVSASHPAMAAGAHEDGVPPGYVSISLVEALNGPILSSPPAPVLLQGVNKKKSGKKKNKRAVTHNDESATTPTIPIEVPTSREVLNQNADDEDEDDLGEEHHEMIPLQTPGSKSVSMHIVNETSSIQASEDVRSILSQDDLVEEELAKMDEKEDDHEDEEDDENEDIRPISPTTSIHSSQESSSSTNRLLADSSTVVTPESRVKIVNVRPQEDDRDEDDEEENDNLKDDKSSEESKLYL
nr:E3 ubiquitin-protein ligase MGRN1-like [Lepeophtheirus salmonis]